tara:strand:- start:276 stop:488 length:213 start_codon:yes stop_codon:yes gene_type:complete
VQNGKISVSVRYFVVFTEPNLPEIGRYSCIVSGMGKAKQELAAKTTDSKPTLPDTIAHSVRLGGDKTEVR